jgi:integrative and conjugative element protein (TIGR02256 family)
MPELIALRADYGPIVLVPTRIIARMRRYQRPAEANREAGGIFVGSYRARNLEIVDCTEPMPHDIRRRYSFERKDKAHADLSDGRWLRSGQKETFVGEWHTHPEADPIPSMIDLSTWQAAVKKYGPLPLFFSICGTRRTRFWLGTPDRITCIEQI